MADPSVSASLPLTLKIKALYPSLSPSERKVADRILEAPARVLEWPVAKLAMASGTSDATVIRVCRSLGFSGYKTLAFAIAKELGERDAPAGLTLGDGAITRQATLGEIPGKIVGMTVEALQNTLRTLDGRDFEQAVRALAGARRVDLYGVGGSACVADDARHKLLRLGLACNSYGDHHLQLMSAVQLGPKDVAVGISHSGRTQDTIDALATAQRAGATTIAITHHLATPLSEICTIRLLTSSRETEFFSEAMASRIAQLAVIDMLFTGLLVKYYDRFAPRLAQSNEAVAGKGQEKDKG